MVGRERQFGKDCFLISLSFPPMTVALSLPASRSAHSSPREVDVTGRYCCVLFEEANPRVVGGVGHTTSPRMICMKSLAADQKAYARDGVAAAAATQLSPRLRQRGRCRLVPVWQCVWADRSVCVQKRTLPDDAWRVSLMVIRRRPLANWWLPTTASPSDVVAVRSSGCPAVRLRASAQLADSLTELRLLQLHNSGGGSAQRHCQLSAVHLDGGVGVRVAVARRTGGGESEASSCASAGCLLGRA